ncbi:MAG: undecaprenyldiphospho-muramoylpentapeptide beta-N-acetylglucosaminyltransferase [Clostridia bacterium]|nr:undecaprenyldiphospho-muramoylpentapeptide beta-N-acetylglucosaminyltransferase [Clostridia bacterium]
MKILFAAGGTGGHINPALAAAGEIRKQYPDTKILFVGTAEKMESRLVPAAGFDFTTIKITGFQRKLTPANIIRNILTVFYILTSSMQARKIIKNFAPDVVVGFGGYVSGPVVRQAAKMGIKTAIHEQNAYPGVTNKTLAKQVDRVMLTVRQAEKYLEPKNPCTVTGLPVRGELLEADRDISRAELGIPDDAVLVLSMGGSLGARTVNEAMVNYIAERCENKKLYFIHAYGQYGSWVPDMLKQKGIEPSEHKNVVLREYIDDMARCMSAADIVIGRAGASTLSELQALSKASLLIPSPNVAENHQYHNAMALVENGAAVMIEEKELTQKKFNAELDRLTQSGELVQKLSHNAGAMAMPDAKKAIAEIIVSLTD